MLHRYWTFTKSLNIIQIFQITDLYRLKFENITFNKQNWQKGLVPYLNLWRKLNQNQEYVKMNSNTTIDYTQNPIITFIVEECSDAVILMQKIHKHFIILNRILRGNSQPDEEITKLSNSLLHQKVGP